MANFPTHIAIGTLVSGALATLTLAANVVAPENLVAVTTAGVLGSVLPDIDLKDSRPSRALFSGLAAFFSFAVLFTLAERLSIAELWILALATFVGIRYVAHTIFHRMSYHRGIYHSILAALFFAFTTAVLYRYLLGRPDGVAWLAGAFMFVGYMVHLTLDEIYSVDVMDTRIKASFGTAIKFFDYRHLGHSAAMAAATAGMFLLTPPTKVFVDGMGSRSLWAELQHRMLPHDKWFGVIGPIAGKTPTAPRAATETSPAANSVTSAPESAPITTGSIPQAAPVPDAAPTPEVKREQD
jgi:membrane-bound metal-dependent hydrolase YbcI (DUF457 family)